MIDSVQLERYPRCAALCGDRVCKKEVKKGGRGKNAHGEGGGGLKEVVGLRASPQEGGGKGIDRWLDS